MSDGMIGLVSRRSGQLQKLLAQIGQICLSSRTPGNASIFRGGRDIATRRYMSMDDLCEKALCSRWKR